MILNRDNIGSLLFESCDKMNVYLSIEQKDMLEKYSSYIKHWNNIYNITSIKNTFDIVTNHIIDSISVLPSLDKLSIKKNINICDVGSGAGLPGIILSIMRPDWNIFCVESIGKKTAFMRQAIGVLNLSNLKIIQSRVESLHGYKFDILISRAFSSLKNFVLLSKHLVDSEGLICAMKGKIPEEEILEFSDIKDLYIDNIEILKVPNLKAQRCLIIIKKIVNSNL
ncbi:glucose inhibited division protein B [Candidatus Kinetoplastibacterium desouzaii TCC079E]|uniref:Ribosomal RNA small subunit methyltransferase G n=1 Tax=Candidatus Kinetoplastidibacterium desouzai TCC079E TaxID=1208919 RepID=M1L3J4_9PROT|nr:16S rRNA (guanine(527)-N(7))-methyltransferase RsmG [Candidatus Kinetoplastibacterium desouzaii]AGF47298.1 glucose inhibited division protein B [Candidatus Kinetoplastibacterium desouzaii TCC079E]